MARSHPPVTSFSRLSHSESGVPGSSISRSQPWSRMRRPCNHQGRIIMIMSSLIDCGSHAAAVRRGVPWA